MNNEYLRVFGLPENNTIYENGLSGTNYGFSYYLSNTRTWSSSKGSWEYVFGIYDGLSGYFSMLDRMSERNPEIEIPEFSFAFFLLDENDRPIEIISKMKVTSEEKEYIGRGSGGPNHVSHNIIMVDLSSLADDGIPRLEFEI